MRAGQWDAAYRQHRAGRDAAAGLLLDTLVIAHRLPTVLSAERIAVMDAGRIAAVGNDADLRASCPLYERLASLQFGDA